MNAIRHPRAEASVLTNEAIEVHLSYLRTGLDAVQTELPILRDKIDALSEKMDSKLLALDQKIESKLAVLDQKMESRFAASDSRTDSKLEALEGRIEAKFVLLTAEVSKNSRQLSDLRGHVKAATWILGGGYLLTLATFVAKVLHWI